MLINISPPSSNNACIFSAKIKHLVLFKGNLSKSYSESKGRREFRKKIIQLDITLGKSKNSALIMTSDLTPDYISINSDYRS